MNQNYPEYILKKLRIFNGLEEEDKSRDNEFQELPPEEAFDQVMKFDGIIGYRYTMLRWIADIFKVKLVSDGEKQTSDEFTQGMMNILAVQGMDSLTAFQRADEICDMVNQVTIE